MKPLVKQLLLTIGIVIVVAFVAFEAGMAVSGNALPAVIIFFGALAVIIWYLLQRRNRDSGMEAALRWAIAWWKRINEEETSRDDWHGTVGYTGQQKFYAFVRKRGAGQKIGREAIMVVSAGDGGFDMARVADSPGPEEISNPFKIVEGYLHITPIPTHELYPKWLDIFPPHLKKGKRGVTVNVGAVGASNEPAVRQEEED